MRPRMKSLFLLTATALTLLTSATQAAERPNILFIFTDDHAFQSISAYGSKINETPNIDRLAREGMIFHRCYVPNSICGPVRAVIQTGKYSHQNGFLVNGNKFNGKQQTFPKLLQQAGYQTAVVGKWHLGDQPEFLPTRHGFDYYFGIPFSNDMGRTSRVKNRYPPLPLLRMDKVIEEEPDQRLLTQRYTAEAVRFIEQNKAKPFFLYLPHTMPHWPQFSSERFAGKSANGKWGDTVEEIDWSTGEILKALKQNGIDKKTLVVFMSDNGG
ncbi:MAG TPA: arylsulfatase, partial [Planctomycetaceae bacterium]|nr:arylsulfatase [Planctomycetaceae bacterium]